jgi:hypothetical protein
MVFARTTGGTPYYGTWQPLSGNEAPHAITRLGVQLPFSLRGRRVQFGYRVGGSGVGGGHEIHIVQAVVNVQGGTAPAPARPTGNAAASDPNAALYARLQAQHEEHNRDAARDEAARREAARAREAAAERARRDEAARLEAARLERARAAARVAPTTACRVCGGNFPHPACSGCGTPGARAAATTAQPGHSSPPNHSTGGSGAIVSAQDAEGLYLGLILWACVPTVACLNANGPDELDECCFIIGTPMGMHQVWRRDGQTNWFKEVGGEQWKEVSAGSHSESPCPYCAVKIG